MGSQGLRALIDTRDSLDRAIAEEVTECRRQGVGWSEIAAIAGVSRPTAISRWKETDMPSIDRSEWGIAPGEAILRKVLHARYGGSGQGGIAPSRSTDNVLLFAEDGEVHGYIDGPKSNGTYEYTGEGQHGDQRMIRGNRKIRDHRLDGRHLRLFQGARGEVTYLGEYEYVSHRTRTTGRGADHGDREVIVFELRRVDG
jgi:hypothetical protein